MSKFKEKLNNFLEASRQLTVSWDEDVKIDSVEENAVSYCGELYPFQLSLDELYINVHSWVKAVNTEIERGEALNFCSTYKYVMSLKGCSEGDNWFERGWMFKVTEYNGDIRIVEEIEGGGYDISWDFLKQNFISVPKELFNLYLKSCEDGDGNASVKIQELAKIMGEVIK